MGRRTWVAASLRLWAALGVLNALTILILWPTQSVDAGGEAWIWKAMLVKHVAWALVGLCLWRQADRVTRWVIPVEPERHPESKTASLMAGAACVGGLAALLIPLSGLGLLLAGGRPYEAWFFTSFSDLPSMAIVLALSLVALMLPRSLGRRRARQTPRADDAALSSPAPSRVALGILGLYVLVMSAASAVSMVILFVADAQGDPLVDMSDGGWLASLFAFLVYTLGGLLLWRQGRADARSKDVVEHVTLGSLRWFGRGVLGMLAFLAAVNALYVHFAYAGEASRAMVTDTGIWMAAGYLLLAAAAWIGPALVIRRLRGLGPPPYTPARVPVTPRDLGRLLRLALGAVLLAQGVWAFAMHWRDVTSPPSGAWIAPKVAALLGALCGFGLLSSARGVWRSTLGRVAFEGAALYVMWGLMRPASSALVDLILRARSGRAMPAVWTWAGQHADFAVGLAFVIGYLAWAHRPDRRKVVAEPGLEPGTPGL